MHQERLHVSLAGPFRMWTDGGHELRVAGEMSRRLIAILLLSRDMRRSRSSLTELLWNNTKGPPSANLRQLLKQTRERLGDHGAHLVADASTVQLVGVENRTERTEGVQEDFFEDAGLGTEEFETWYRIEQRNFENLPIRPATPERVRHTRPRPVVGLTDRFAQNYGPNGAQVAAWVANSLRDVIVLNAFVDFRDLRGTASDADCDLELRISAHEIGPDQEVSIAAFFGGLCKWSQSTILPGSDSATEQREAVLVLAHQAAAILERMVMRLSAGREAQGGNQLFDAVTRLFSLRRSEVTRAVEILDQLAQSDGDARACVWGAFARITQCEQRFTDDQTATMAEAGALLQQAFDLDPAEIGGLSVGAYYAAIAQGDMARAFDLSDEALDLAPFSPFAHTIRAALSLQAGDVKAARPNATMAKRLGHYGPMRHTVAAMDMALASLASDHQAAVDAGRVLLQGRPNSVFVLRHITPSLTQIGALAEARRCLSHLDGLDKAGPCKYPLMAAPTRTALEAARQALNNAAAAE